MKNERCEMTGQRVIALLGGPDAPTDAVEERCRDLSKALLAESFELILERVAWPEREWTRQAQPSTAVRKAFDVWPRPC